MKTVIITLLTPTELGRIRMLTDDAELVEAASITDLCAKMQSSGRGVAIVSSARIIRPGDVTDLRGLSAAFPSSIAAVVSADDVPTTVNVGRAEIRTVLDARRRGYEESLDAFLLSGRSELAEFKSRAIAFLSEGFDATPGFRAFLTVALEPRQCSGRELATRMGILPSTLVSRFFRKDLPAPKKYLAFAELLWSAKIGESSGISVAAISARIGASSPQSFGRSVRLFSGVGSAEFLRTHDGEAMLSRFRDELIQPYISKLNGFDPFQGCGVSLTRAPVERRRAA